MSKVLVTGGKGQLATSLKDIASETEHMFIFVDHEELDITDAKAVQAFFKKENLDFCINCAAYTAVDKAESETEKARSINIDGAGILAKACNEFGVKLIQISTDYVFDGRKTSAYKEDDQTNPLGAYGKTKLFGEMVIAHELDAHIIIRASWLYAEHGHNFVKTMLRLGKERATLDVVFDQIGTPTYAGDLAGIILMLINKNTDKYGTYHYSNDGTASWYDFAAAIFQLADITCKLKPIKTDAYPTVAERPAYSVMDKSKIKSTFDLEIPHWKESLKSCLNRLDAKQLGEM